MQEFFRLPCHGEGPHQGRQLAFLPLGHDVGEQEKLAIRRFERSCDPIQRESNLCRIIAFPIRHALQQDHGEVVGEHIVEFAGEKVAFLRAGGRSLCSARILSYCPLREE